MSGDLQPRSASRFGKTLENQIDEIDSLVFAALEQLNQARYALETLKERVAAETGKDEDPED